MIQGCYKCGGKLHETGGTASNVEGMSQEQQMLMMIASTLKENISKLGQEDGVQSTLQFLAERGLIDGSSEEGMQQGVSLIQAAVEHVSQAHGGRGISEEGLPEYTSGGYDDMKGGGEMIKRADGSYSRRGFWDNIRAAAGSGNPVTPEMRATEKKLKKAQVGLEQVEALKKSIQPMMGAFGPKSSQFLNGINPATGTGSYADTKDLVSTTANNTVADDNTVSDNDDPNNITPAYTTVHSGISAVQLKDEKDARKQQRWLNNLSFGASPAQTGAGAFLRGVVGLSTIPRTVSNTIKGTRTHLAQGYDASGNKLGDPQYIDHSDWKDMQQQQRKIARNQRREDRMDTGIGRMTNRIVEAPERAYYGVKGMFQKQEGGEQEEDNDLEMFNFPHVPAIHKDEHGFDVYPGYLQRDVVSDVVYPKGKASYFFDKVFNRHQNPYESYDRPIGTKEVVRTNIFGEPVNVTKVFTPDGMIKTKTTGTSISQDGPGDAWDGKKTYGLNLMGDMVVTEKAGRGDRNRYVLDRDDNTVTSKEDLIYPRRAKRIRKNTPAEEFKRDPDAVNVLPDFAITPFKGGGEWNPFEDDRPKVTMNIHKPLFQNGGDWQKFLDEKNYTGSEDFMTVLRDYDAWKNQQNSNDPSDNSNINNSNQSNTPEVNNANQPYTQYGTDPLNTSVALQTLGSLTNFRRGAEEFLTSGYDQRQNLSRNIQAFGTMGQQAMNPADPFSGGPLAGSFANQRPGMTGTQTGVAVSGYLAGEAGDKGMSTFAKRGGSYEVGGEYDLTDEELMMLKSMGYEYEALRK